MSNVRPSESERTAIISPRARRSARKGRYRRLTGLAGFLFIVAISAAVFGGYMKRGSGAFRLESFESAVVRREPLMETVVAQGYVLYPGAQRITPPESATVTGISARIGDIVQKGDILMRLASDDLQAQIDTTRRESDSLERSLELLESEREITDSMYRRAIGLASLALERAESDLRIATALHRTGSISLDAVETARIEHLDAESKYDDAVDRAKLESLRASSRQADLNARIAENTQLQETLASRLSALTVRAGVTGTVVSLPAQVGSTVTNGDAIVHIIDYTRTNIRALVPYGIIPTLRSGSALVVYIDEASIEVEISDMGAEALRTGDSPVPVVELILTCIDPSPGIIEGAPARVEIRRLLREQTLVLPRGAYLSTGREQYVYVTKNDTAHKRRVNFGIIGESKIEIASGLSEGDEVIISSYAEYFDQDEIEIHNTEGKADD